MKPASLLESLRALLYTFDATSAAQKAALLKQLSVIPLNAGKQLFAYHEMLMYMLAYPDNRLVYDAAVREMKRIATLLRHMQAKPKSTLQDCGLPFTRMTARFTADMLEQLEEDKHCAVQLDSFEEGGRSLSAVLEATLPVVEKEKAAVSDDNIELLDALGIRPANRLRFILSELRSLDAQPKIKDLLWQELRAFVTIDAQHISFSRAFNRVQDADLFFHDTLQKRIHFEELLHAPLPAPETLSAAQRNQLISVIRRAMVLTMRETDTSTFMQPVSLRYFILERGISVAVYGMTAPHQLPLQSYIGYTLFKNGFPAAYGGSWVFGNTALFGLNIFDSFRGGESAVIMGQLLRVYHQLFSLHSIEVEAYQIGKDNEDGIRSGAYWFYHRFGFRSLNAKLRKVADEEQRKIARSKNHRSSRKTLLTLAESNVALTITPSHSHKTDDYLARISAHIVRYYQGIRRNAVKHAVNKLMVDLQVDEAFVNTYRHSFEEWALFAECYGMNEKIVRTIIRKLIVSKETDPYSYNKSVSELIKKMHG
ncbi:MAG: hypothetical protein IM638_06880 [Bacteroidetes bacterium]|nr:hypothetical protein [Bacteroidota bacterium]